MLFLLLLTSYKNKMYSIKRINASFQARIIQPMLKRNFAITKYGRRISEFQNRFEGKRCFFIGNGPSLDAKDLTTLHEHNEICFGFNRVYHIFDKTLWRPTFYISQDEKMLVGCAEVVDKLDLPVKFIPIQLKWYYNIEIKDAFYFNMKAPKEESGEPVDFSINVADTIYQGTTGMYTAAQFAAYMGFQKIYFIGVDHHFRISQNNKGEIVVDNTVKDYFSDKYNEDKNKLYIPNTEKSTLAYVAIKNQCEKRGIEVFNATRGGKLEVFPRVDFDMLFNSEGN